MSRKFYSLFLFLLLIGAGSISAQTIKGIVTDERGEPINEATVSINKLNKGTWTDVEGKFKLTSVPSGTHSVSVSVLGYTSQTQQVSLSGRNEVSIRFKLKEDNQLDEIEVFGERFKQPEKLEAITRMPLRPSEQIQSISIISNKLITTQGVLTVADAMRNVPGVSLFGSYGGVKESMSARGFRGIPILKNGVRIDSQFQTASGIIDMQGVESIQMIKGSAAVTQGVITDIGNAGGVIDVVTKTPKFINAGEVSIKTGSWGLFRPTFDIQNVLDKNKTAAFRLNGAYERTDNYRPVVSNERVYINPSFEWRPTNRTTINLEGDYLNENRTPVTSTVNFADQGTNALYDMPHDKFLGFRNDNVNTKVITYSASIKHQLSDLYSIRAAYYAGTYKTDNTSTSLDTIKGGYTLPQRSRTLGRSFRDDKNSTFQFDFIGKDVYTGPLKHTFQLGFDYRTADASTKNLNDIFIDVVDIKAPGRLDNARQNVSFIHPDDTIGVRSKYDTYGIMAQEVMTINKYVKAVLGLRYSAISLLNDKMDKKGVGSTDAGRTKEDAWDPMLGLMFTPTQHINVFGSYTTSTSLRNASYILVDRITRAGASRTKQFETGIKSDWLNNRLRFNFTYFHIFTDNLVNSEYETGSTKATGYYYKAGDLVRDGIEVELNGSILDNLQVMIGYAYLDARYKNSPSYVNGSAPLNTPKHTANGWVDYTINKGPLKGLSAGVGVYYVGKRPVNDFSTKYDGHTYNPGVKPFDMPAYTTVNAHLNYTYSKFTARVFFNNIFDELGYNSYFRGGYINQIDPRNFAAQVSYRF